MEDIKVENYKENITYKGFGGTNITRTRLRVATNYLNYGYKVVDEKVARKIITGKSVLWEGVTRAEAEAVADHIRETGNIPPSEPIVFPNRILVTNEKHGQFYYSTPTVEAYKKVALKIVKERKNYGWLREPEAPEPIDITDETIKTLPESFHAEALRRLETYKRNVRDYEQEVKDYESIAKALAGDGHEAVMVLNDRIDHEYEGYEIIDPITVD